MRRISFGAKRCLDLLRWYQKRFRDVFPKQKTLAAQLERGKPLSLRTLRRWIAELVAAGLLIVTYHGPRGAEYRLVDKPVELVDESQMSFGFENQDGSDSVLDFGRDYPSPPLTEYVRYGSNTSAPPQPQRSENPQPQSSLPAVHPASDPQFQTYFGVFLAAGKALNQPDMHRAAEVWRHLPLSDRLGATQHARQICQATEDPKFIPLPVNHLQSQAWTRIAMKRTTLSVAGEMLRWIMDRKERKV